MLAKATLNYTRSIVDFPRKLLFETRVVIRHKSNTADSIGEADPLKQIARLALEAERRKRYVCSWFSFSLSRHSAGFCVEDRIGFRDLSTKRMLLFRFFNLAFTEDFVFPIHEAERLLKSFTSFGFSVSLSLWSTPLVSYSLPKIERESLLCVTRYRCNSILATRLRAGIFRKCKQKI